MLKRLLAGFTLLLFVLSPIPGLPGAIASEPDRMAVYGDSRGSAAIHRKVVEGILTFNPRVVFHTGDLVTRGAGQKDWDALKGIIAPLTEKAEFFPVRGNHDTGSSFYFDTFTLPGNEKWYSVERFGVHFILLDSNTRISPGSEQYRWLEAELQRPRKKEPFIAVILHHAPFSTGIYADEKGLQKKIVPLFEKYAVDIVFSGHHHVYERLRVRGVTYIVTGGGGDPLHFQFSYSADSEVFRSVNHFCIFYISGGELVLEAYDLDLNLIDQFRIRKRK